MLGGRLGAYRDGLAAGDLKPALVRNLYRGEAPADAALAHVERELLALRDALAGDADRSAGRGRAAVSAPEFSRPERLDTIGEPRARSRSTPTRPNAPRWPSGST